MSEDLKLKIMILDDQQGPIYANIIINHCEIDCDVKIANTLTIAEDNLEQFQYDYIFIDYYLADGEMGYQIMGKVKETQKKAVTVLLSGEYNEIIDNKRNEYGIEHFIDKNYTNIVEMVDRFNQILR